MLRELPHQQEQFSVENVPKESEMVEGQKKLETRLHVWMCV
jgi:hypothetical protein